jgi:hypothetical protein
MYHQTDTGDAHMIGQPPQGKLILAKQAEVSEMLNDMQRFGFIEESDSPWSSPVILIMKKNGELCFHMNYRKLNDITKIDYFSLPGLTTL